MDGRARLASVVRRAPSEGMTGPRRALLVPFLALAVGAATGCNGDKVEGPPPSAPESIRLTSAAFDNGGAIPKQFTCDGDDTSPPLRWSGVPGEAAELALLVEDPDAPGGTFVHWALFGIDPGARQLEAGRVPAGAKQAENSFGDPRYGGPCPPEGDEPHRYAFALYALSERLALESGAPPADVRAAIGKAALARGQLVGKYGR